MRRLEKKKKKGRIYLIITHYKLNEASDARVRNRNRKFHRVGRDCSYRPLPTLGFVETQTKKK